MTKKKWIAGAIGPSGKGALHQNLGVPQGQKIPEAMLERASHMSGKVGQEARLARTLKRMRGG
jgi:hypothetical protein